MRILLISDALEEINEIRAALASQNFMVHSIGFGSKELQGTSSFACDAIVLNSQADSIQGATFLESLRRSGVTIPVLGLFGREVGKNACQFLTKGADDFLVRPFRTPELVARLRAVIRRHKGHARSLIQSGPIALDIEKQTAAIAESNLPLTSMEYRILETLALNKGKAVSLDLLQSDIYGHTGRPKSKVLSVFVTRLRRKISQATGGDSYIRNVYGYGYILQDA